MTEYMNVIIHSVKEWVNTRLGSYVQKGDVDGKLVPPLSANGSDAGKTVMVNESGTGYELVQDNSSERIDSVLLELGAFKNKVDEDLDAMQTDVTTNLNTLKTTIAGDIATAKEQAIAEANNAADAVKNDLLSGAGEAYDTLRELGKLIDENVAAIEVLAAVATGKADKGHTHSWDELNDKPFYATESESNVIIFNGAPLFNDNTAEIESDYFSKDRELIMIDELGEEHSIVNRGFIDPRGGDFEGYYVWGNAALVPYFDGEDTGEAWAFITNYSVKEVTDVKLAKVFTSDDSINGSQRQVTLAYFGWHTDVHYLDEMFIPDSIARAGNIMSKENPTGTGSFSMNRRNDMEIGDYSHVEGMYNYASGYASHAEGYGNAASNYVAHAEGYNTTASGYASHAEGYYATASDSYAHAEGYQTTASGQASHAEGDQTVASEYRAHAEGYYTNASGMNAHAEGYRSKASGNTAHSEGYETEASGAKSHAEGEYSKAIGDNSHAEGYQTTANKEYTHAEGAYTVADGRYSHVEGYNAKTSGLYSHAEGFYTEAAGESQHVQGKYNVVDTEGAYAHIVGNGDYDARSNAHTLDWDGNAWYAGNLKVGGTSYEDADEVALKSDIEANRPRVYADHIILTDSVNGFNYMIKTVNGNLVSYALATAISVAEPPSKTTFYDGDFIDLSGMKLIAIYPDGSTIEVADYTCEPTIMSEDTSVVTIIYNEGGNKVTTELSVDCGPFEDRLIDFDYTDNEDGTYTLTGWKQTLNGEPSTRMIVPNSSKVII